MRKNIKIFVSLIIITLIGGGLGTYYTLSKNVKPVTGDTGKTQDFTFTKQNYPKVDCATAMLPLAAELTRTVLNISVEEAKNLILCSKTPEAYKNLINGNADIIFLFGPSDEEIKSAQEKGFELEKATIGKDAFVFINNKENPVKSLTQEQLQDIYEGKINNWKQVGGNDAEILAYQRPKNSGSQTLMEEFMKGKSLVSAPSELVGVDMFTLVDFISSYDNSQNSLGYSVFYYANEMYRNPNVNFIKVDGVEPTKDTIKSGSYPLTKDVYAVIRSNEPKDSPARKLIDWVLTDKGQTAVEKGGYVRVK